MKAPNRLGIEITLGELVDRVTILELKATRFRDLQQRETAECELLRLTAVLRSAKPASAELDQLIEELRWTNETLWNVEARLHRHEVEKDFGAEFVALARSVYRQNAHRAALRQRIDQASGWPRCPDKDYSCTLERAVSDWDRGAQP